MSGQQSDEFTKGYAEYSSEADPRQQRQSSGPGLTSQDLSGRGMQPGGEDSDMEHSGMYQTESARQRPLESEWVPGQTHSHPAHPSVGDKIRGEAEKLAGKVAGKPGMVEKGQERQTGQQHMRSGQWMGSREGTDDYGF